MTIVDPSHPKAQMAFSDSRSSGNTETDDLPSYSQHSASPLSPSPANVPWVPGPGIPYSPESLSQLNPEAAKKLAREAAASGREPLDYGFISGDTAARLQDLPDEGGFNLAPPSFAEGEVRPTFELDSAGNIVSHDHLLNTSPTALLRFLRLQGCSSPPSLVIHLRGSHTEKRSETIHETHNGRTRTRTETRDVEVEDFSFSIDAAKFVEQGLGSARGVGGVRGVLFDVGGWEAVHRGGKWRTRERREDEYPQAKEGGIALLEDGEEEGAALLAEAGNIQQSTGRAGRNKIVSKWVRPGIRETRKLDREKRERDSRGFPGFVHPDCLVDMDEDVRPLLEQQSHPAVLFHSHFVDLVETHAAIPFAMTRTNAGPLPALYDGILQSREKRDEQVRKVVEQYCESDKLLKELRVEKECYGWNWKLLEQGLRATIDATHHSGTVQIQFRSTLQTIVIRPENNFSKIFSAPIWIKILLWIVLLYPIFLLIEFFIGERYENLRVAFPLTRWRRLPLPRSTGASASTAASSSSSHIGSTHALELAKLLAARPPKISHLPTDKSFIYLTGTQEGEWLRSWETAIVAAVRNGRRGVYLQESEQVTKPDPRNSLRGYSQ